MATPSSEPMPGLAIQAERLGRVFQVRTKAAGLMASLRNFWRPQYREIVAVHDLDMTIHPGEIIGFLGPNGAGKTTTLKMLSGLIAPTTGRARVLGHDPFQREAAFLGSISLVMGQKQNLWWDLPPVETFAIHREIYAIPAADYERRSRELIDLLEIGECLTTPTRQLSLGQRMRCELATALLHQPRILFLDEPTIGLDILMQKRIRSFLRDFHRQHAPTILLTSHYMEDVAALAQRVIVINHGRKVFDGPLETLRTRARPEKILTVTFQNTPPDFAPNALGDLIRQDASRFTLRILRERAQAIAAQLYATGAVLDLSLEEPPLEESIAPLFRTIPESSSPPEASPHTGTSPG